MSLDTGRCPVCATPAEVFLRLAEAPVHCHRLQPTPEAARSAPRGPMDLAHCGDCGHVFNVAFDPSLVDYGPGYENPLDHSETFQAFARSLARRLIDRYGLRHTVVADIGCGGGGFLRLLCGIGDNRGIGFDRGHGPRTTVDDTDPRLTIHGQDLPAGDGSLRADLVCCRHVLEHVPDPKAFLEAIKAAIGVRADTVVYFEVPNGAFIWRDMSVWDLIYEHVSYFVGGSLARLFRDGGFQVINVAEDYGGQFLSLEARPGNGTPKVLTEPLTTHSGDLTAFADAYKDKLAFWRRTLDGIAVANRRAVVWGAGSKATSFLNALDPTAAGAVSSVIDINPQKQGRYVTGTGHPILAPESLAETPPDDLIIMNPLYRDEIKERLRAIVGGAADTVTWHQA